jgi:hypothetical protein
MRVFATRAIVYLPALAVAALFAWRAFPDSPSFTISALVALLLLPSLLFLLIAAGSYAGTRTNRAASQAFLTIVLAGLTLILAAGLAHSASAWLMNTQWHTVFSGPAADRNTIILASALNLFSGLLCYIAFAIQLREDLIRNVRPRFQSFLDTYTE